jgi:hypothetical protein
MNNFPTKNLGVLIDQRPTDWLGGTIAYKEIVPSGDWRPFLPAGENQFNNVIDRMACVTYSHLNSLEVQHKQQAGEEINLSDRFTAKMSGTTHEGNWQYKVADSVRDDGVVLESDYGQGDPNDNWNTYYQSIPQSVLDKKISVDMNYEWLTTDIATLKHHLKHAPIQITIPGQNPNHAVLLVYIDDNNIFYYFDSYPGGNYIKTMSQRPASAMKIVLNKPINQGEIMAKKFIINEGGKLGVLVCEGFTFGGGFAKDEKSLEALKEVFEFDGTEKTINLN